jgi:hypothetical protein
MANALYPKTKAKLMRAQIDLQSVNIKAALLDQSTYTFNASHEFMSSVSGIVARTGLLTGKAVNMTTGAFDSDDPTAQAVTGSDIYRLVLYVDTGSDATSAIIMFQDTGISTVPFGPDGSDIRILVDATGWFIL